MDIALFALFIALVVFVVALTMRATNRVRTVPVRLPNPEPPQPQADEQRQTEPQWLTQLAQLAEPELLTQKLTKQP